jgi:penicillin-binding protein 1C
VTKRRAAGTTVVCLAIGAWIRLGPIPAELLDLRRRAGVQVLDARGEVLYSTVSSDGGRATPLEVDQLSRVIVSATLAAEDHRFFDHPGLDPRAALRAFWVNARAGRAVEGGSTLTQQTIDLLRGTEDRPTALAKASEALLALRLEHRRTKPEILALYLSLAPYGNGRIGITEASRFYFGLSPRDLTLAQAAYLAGLPRAPSRFDPVRRPDAAGRRQRVVLARMERFGLITKKERRAAEAERIVVSPSPDAFLARHFVERVLSTSREATTPGAGVTIRTTLDAGLQREIGGIVRAQRPALEKHGANHVAIAVLDNRSGGWLAWEGSGDYFGPEGTIDGVRVPRQPGSALKPFTYALAFERGLPSSRPIPDVPSTFPTAEDGILYKPRNYDGRHHGPLLPRVALASSVNVAAIWTLSQIGVEPLLHRLRAAGLSTLDRAPDYYGYGLTMGNAEVRLDELVVAYATLARGGVRPDARVADDGRAARPGVRVFDARSAFLVSDALADDRAREPGFGRASPLEFAGRRVAVKTGTSQSYHDNWTVGYTGDVTVGVWVGNFDRRPLRGSSGVTGAAPIFHAVMNAAIERYGTAEEDAPFRPPPSARRVELCELSGLSPTSLCPRRTREWLAHAEPEPGRCGWHRREGDRVAVAWPADYAAWAAERERGARGASLPTADPAAARRNARTRPAGRAAFAIATPPDGATYWIDPTLRAEFQGLDLATRGANGSVRWSVNGRSLEGPAVSRAFWRLSPGVHHFEARDGSGATARARIVVR